MGLCSSTTIVKVPGSDVELRINKAFSKTYKSLTEPQKIAVFNMEEDEREELVTFANHLDELRKVLIPRWTGGIHRLTASQYFETHQGPRHRSSFPQVSSRDDDLRYAVDEMRSGEWRRDRRGRNLRRSRWASYNANKFIKYLEILGHSLSNQAPRVWALHQVMMKQGINPCKFADVPEIIVDHLNEEQFKKLYFKLDEGKEDVTKYFGGMDHMIRCEENRFRRLTSNNNMVDQGNVNRHNDAKEISKRIPQECRNALLRLLMKMVYDVQGDDKIIEQIDLPENPQNKGYFFFKHRYNFVKDWSRETRKRVRRFTACMIDNHSKMLTSNFYEGNNYYSDVHRRLAHML